MTNTNSAVPPRHTNRLAHEKSPYLLQHAHNPVDWFAWNDEAFAKARTESKPIFLSIGYSTCHWCHVMERESFEDEKIGDFLNAHFVSIKVDREERPDVDKIYMTFVQSTTGAGGWPLNVFLTADMKPFYGGTYFPPAARHGHPSFLQVLEHIRQLWATRRDDLIESAADIHARLAQMAETNPDTFLALTPEVLRHAGLLLKESYDPSHGGFGGAPKFPQPSQPQLLLRYARRFQDEEAQRMVLHTCDRMAAGGIHDQLGGGFSRYSVDAGWLVPHFEKMLYDNAQLAQLYLDAFLVSGEARHAAVARDILDYVLRDMTHPDGGFYSAEDADSEGIEGKFYCWTRTELSRLLTAEEFNVAVRHFGITEEGNFIDHSHPQPLPNQNVLSIVEPVERRSPDRHVEAQAEGKRADQEIGVPPADADFELLTSAKAKMLAARHQRVRPHLDDKILASWNGLMLGAFARAYAVLGENSPNRSSRSEPQNAAERRSPDRLVAHQVWNRADQEIGAPVHGEEKYRAAAENNLAFLQAKLWDATSKTLYHRWRDGERDHVQLLEAYASLLSGVIELYEATLEPRHLDFANALADAMLARFYDAANGGFWQSAADATDLILRVKEDYDGAEPSGNSVAILALLKLGAITGRPEFSEAAGKSLRLFAQRLQQTPQALPHMLQALDFWLQEPRRVVVVGDTDSTNFHELSRAAHSVYQPNKVVLGNAGAVEEFARTLPAKEKPLVYLCTGNACQAPTSEVAAVRKNLSLP